MKKRKMKVELESRILESVLVTRDINFSLGKFLLPGDSKWPFHLLTGGHQQPLNRVTFSPSKLLHLETLKRVFHESKNPLSTQFSGRWKNHDVHGLLLGGLLWKDSEPERRAQAVSWREIRVLLASWYICKYISKSIIFDIQYLTSNIY